VRFAVANAMEVRILHVTGDRIVDDRRVVLDEPIVGIAWGASRDPVVQVVDSQAAIRLSEDGPFALPPVSPEQWQLESQDLHGWGVDVGVDEAGAVWQSVCTDRDYAAQECRRGRYARISPPPVTVRDNAPDVDPFVPPGYDVESEGSTISLRYHDRELEQFPWDHTASDYPLLAFAR
jgi:hypothetical protein